MAASAVTGRVGIAAQVDDARARGVDDHAAMLRALNDLFRSGCAPTIPLDGPYAGTLVTTTVGRAADRAISAIGHVYMPWRGKVFDVRTTGGINLFTQRSMGLIRPFYPPVAALGGDRDLVTAYPFRTSTGPGVIDRDRTVLTIDYDIPANPFALVRRVRDELVEAAPGYYLGKAHLRVGRGWRTVAYFALEPWQ